MAVSIKKEPNKKHLIFELNNGDYAAFYEAKKKWKIKEETDLIQFMIAIFRKADKPYISIEVEGDRVTASPAESILEKEADNGEAE